MEEIGNLIATIKNFFKHNVNENKFVCLDCEKEWSGKNVELFIKHQIDEKHFNYAKRPNDLQED